MVETGCLPSLGRELATCYLQVTPLTCLRLRAVLDKIL